VNERKDENMASKKKATRSGGIVGRYVIARCTGAGVHAGIVESTSATHTVLRDARRIWYWTGAASLSEIAVYGLNPSKAAQSKIAAKVESIRLRDSDICELIVCCDTGRKSIDGAAEWRA
jgi:hypothetical protein